MMQFQQSKLKHGIFSYIAPLLFTVAVLISSNPSPVGAQESVGSPQRVTAIGEMQCGNQVSEFSLEVWNVGAEGGEAYAKAIIYSQACINQQNLVDHAPSVGVFSGGPNGVATINVCIFGDYCPLGTFQFIDGKEVKAVAESGEEGTLIVQNPEAFDAWRVAPITSEYIYTTYGIRVEDSFGDDQWAQKSWSDQELILLNDVLKELPPGLRSQLALTRIIRNKTDLDENGNPDPSTYGVYYSCGSPPDKDCTSASGAIRIFDKALIPSDFTDDPNGYKEFKGTILHELIHSLQYKKDEYSIYENAYTSPLVQNYMEATRFNTAIDRDIDQNGWAWYTPPGEWQLFTAIVN
ncbi:MAG: hypothetical protein MUO77_15500, partial [Anaerolineales bacterium]|nr:hypothetical protein [Anaerolineales bacterium]